MDIEIETTYTITLDHGDTRIMKAVTRYIGTPETTFNAHAEKLGSIERKIAKEYPRV